MGSPIIRPSADDKFTSQSVWISKHPPPSKPLPPLPAGQDAASLKTVTSARLFTSSNMHCRTDTHRSTCAGFRLEDEYQGNVSPTTKRSFTPDHVAGLCSQLDVCSVGKRESIAASSRSSERTITPVPSLAFSCSSSSTVLEPDSPPGTTRVEPDDREYTGPAAITKQTSLHRKSRRPLAVKSQHNELRRTISPPMPSPVLDGSQFQARLPPFQDGHAYHPGRAVPMIPSRCSNDCKLSDVSFIDWDSDEENRPFPQFAKVNASLKKGMADIRATRKPKPSSIHPQALRNHKIPESSCSSSILPSQKRSNKLSADEATKLRNKKSQNLRRCPTTTQPCAKSGNSLITTTAANTSATSSKRHSTQILAQEPIVITLAEPQVQISSERKPRKKPKKLSIWIRKASCT